MDDHIAGYISQIQSTIGRIGQTDIRRIVSVLHEARLSGSAIFLLGNGGSAATASHWANDLAKGATRPDLPRLRVMALTDNVPLITAWANDTSYEKIFAEQLANFLQPRDVVIGISGSGNSPNVLEAMRFAREHGALTIGLTGFSGGRLKDLVDICVVVPSDSMEQIEDLHLILTHIISTSLRRSTGVGLDNLIRPEAGVPNYGLAAGAQRGAVFIDRDGVINENRSNYVKSWDEFTFLRNSLDALVRLAQCRLKVVIVSNQSAIGRQHVSREIVEDIHRRMVQRIEEVGGHVDRVLYCPHHPDENCECRKPRPGLLVQASHELEIDLTRSYVIGDALEDVEAGIAVGCRTLLVRTGRGTEAMGHLDGLNGNRPVVVDDLKGAVEWILECEGASRRGEDDVELQEIQEFTRR